MFFLCGALNLWWTIRDLNPWPPARQADALPAAPIVHLCQQKTFYSIRSGLSRKFFHFSVEKQIPGNRTLSLPKKRPHTPGIWDNGIASGRHLWKRSKRKALSESLPTPKRTALYTPQRSGRGHKMSQVQLCCHEPEKLGGMALEKRPIPCFSLFSSLCKKLLFSFNENRSFLKAWSNSAIRARPRLSQDPPDYSAPG